MRHISPTIPQANHARFLGPHSFALKSEESRMCAWCTEGHGTLRINGRRYDVEPFHYLVVPWGHDVRYSVVGGHILGVANVHLIPWHDPQVRLEWTVAHLDHATHLRGVPWRQDRPIEGMERLLHFQLWRSHPLVLLSEYIVRHWESAVRDAAVLQHCAWALLAEIRNEATAPPPLPYRIQRMRHFIEAHMDDRISVDDLAAVIDRNPSQVNRLCQRYLQISPGRWITDIKIDHACKLLVGSSLTIARIAYRTGYEDPFYFSRVFKKHMGVSPRTYRQQTPPL